MTPVIAISLGLDGGGGGSERDVQMYVNAKLKAMTLQWYLGSTRSVAVVQLM